MDINVTGLSQCDDVLPIYVGDGRTDEDAFKVNKLVLMIITGCIILAVLQWIYIYLSLQCFDVLPGFM